MLTLHDIRGRQLSPVESLESGVVKMYTCGPSVYGDVNLGELRAYLLADWIRRALEMDGVSVEHVKGISDVSYAHRLELTQPELPGEDTGELAADEMAEEAADPRPPEQTAEMEAVEGETPEDVEGAEPSADIAEEPPVDDGPESESPEALGPNPPKG